MSSVLRFLVSALVGGVVSAGAVLFVGQSDTTTKILSAAPSTSLISQPAAGQLTANQLYRRTSSGVVSIQARSSNGTATGSGFEIDTSGLILTNQHVIDGARELTVSIDSGTTRTARVLGFDRSTDLALLKIDAGGVGLHPLRLADSSRIQVGDRAYAIGDPFGLDRTLTAGVVSALQRHIDAPNGFSIDHVIQTDAALNPGNSGGPLLNAAGEVIGINAQIASSQSNPFGGSGSQGSGGRIGFAIPSNTATQVIAALKRAGHVDHAYLGVESATIGDIPAQVAGAKQGVLVQKVQAGGPAAKAGLRGGTHPTSVNGSTILSGGDVIISVDAHPISSAEELSQAVSSHRPGDRLRLEILRSGARQRLTVALGTQPTRAGNG